MWQRHIAEVVVLTQSVMWKTFAGYQELGTVQNRSRKKSPKSNSNSPWAFQNLWERRNPIISLSQFQRQLLEAIVVSVSVETIKTRLCAQVLYSRRRRRSYGFRVIQAAQDLIAVIGVFNTKTGTMEIGKIC